MIHIQYNKLLQFPAIYFLVGDFAILFSGEFFQVDQGRLTFERLDLLVSIHLPSKFELLHTSESLLLRSDLFKSYRICLSFDFGRIAVVSFRLVHNYLLFARFIGFFL